ncbi:unnamed protein product [Lampetra fluviatilis]
MGNEDTPHCYVTTESMSRSRCEGSQWHSQIFMAALILAVGIDTQADVACNSSTQYERDGRCCEKCPPGHFALSWCHGASPTRCEVCRPGTFSANYDIASACGPCKRCNTGLRQVVLESCLPTRDTRCVFPHAGGIDRRSPSSAFRLSAAATVASNRSEAWCGCGNGTHEARLANGGILFWCCANCPAGQEIREECDIPDFKTKCTPCPAGSFSNGSGSPCVNHTRCGAVASPPTDTSDSVCVDPTVCLRNKHQDSRTVECHESSLERERKRNGLTRNGTLPNHQSSQLPLEDDSEGGAERVDFVRAVRGHEGSGKGDQSDERDTAPVAVDIAGYGGDVHEMRSMQRATEPDDHNDDEGKAASVGECDVGGRAKSGIKFVRRPEPGKWNKVRLCHCLVNEDSAPRNQRAAKKSGRVLV